MAFPVSMRQTNKRPGLFLQNYHQIVCIKHEVTDQIALSFVKKR